MRDDDHRVYRSFEEFEREELRRIETMGASVDDMIEALFGEELEVGIGSNRQAARHDDEDE
jgi:hypothetical protein